MLAQNLRPRSISQFVGNRSILKAFQNYFSTKNFENIPSVILLSGQTGSGKTTMALLAAETINCETPVYNDKLKCYEPCGKCIYCSDIEKENFSKDVRVFDSSQMSPEDIANLNEYASTGNLFGSKFKVIILDEAQILSTKSKGTLLLLLEKKRKDCVFILCTMSPESMDKAIVSRCTTFLFKPLSISDIGSLLTSTLDNLDSTGEKYPFNAKALVDLAYMANGSARRALSLLDQCIASELYTDELIEQELGFFSEQKGYDIFSKLLSKDQSFFQSIANVKTEDFYTYSWAILGSIQKTLQTLDHEDFKYKSSLAIYNSQNYKPLCEAYLNINRDTGNWFREHIYNYYIGEYMKRETPVLTRVRQKVV